MECMAEHEVGYLLGSIAKQLGELSKSVRGRYTDSVYLSGDIDKITRDKIAELTNVMMLDNTTAPEIKRISATL